jgi:hypothetical protein
VKLYRFALRRNDGSNALERALALDDVASAWSTVGEIAHNATDGRIFVKDEDEKVVIMIGVASARALLEGKARNKPAQRSADWPLPIAV